MFRYSTILCFLLFALTSCEDENTRGSKNPVSEEEPSMTPLISYKLINQYPHSTDAFTEGLQYVDGHMYESTGQSGTSYLIKYELETGKELQRFDLEDKYFGEGMTVMGDKIYMLTYKSKTGFVFDKNTFKLLKTFPFNTKEGWGMTNDSTNLIYSDGTPNIYFLNPESLQEVRKIEVRDNYGPVIHINELEYINGYIYANQWNTNLILKIDPQAGKVVAHANLSNIRRQAGLNPTGYEDVLNGIAYDKENNRIFVTGKFWPKTFEIKLDN